ncbi:MAG: dihydrodipicolinate synthase family protein [Gemmatimonadota bacterium]
MLNLRAHLAAGHVIPAHPLALTARRRLDERRQRALTRYYIDAGAGGLAIAVHTTQFALRGHGLLGPVLELAAESARSWRGPGAPPLALIAGVIGPTRQALGEARLARDAGFDAALLSLAGLGNATDRNLLAHCRRVAEVLPLFGFYLQSAVGGRLLSYRFWREFAEMENVVAIKIAPFNRYQTFDVVRAVRDSGRRDIALYTGNDDNIVPDLITAFPGAGRSERRRLHLAGGLLGQWAVWTERAVWLLHRVREIRDGRGDPLEILALGARLTDANSAVFDVANGFAGCIAGIHEVLRRQRLLRGTWCLDPRETLSPGQAHEISRVIAAYPELNDNNFVRSNLDRWLS